MVLFVTNVTNFCPIIAIFLCGVIIRKTKPQIPIYWGYWATTIFLSDSNSGVLIV